MNTSSELEVRIARFLGRLGRPASSQEVAREVLRASLPAASAGSESTALQPAEERLGRMIERLLGAAPKLILRAPSGWILTGAASALPAAADPDSGGGSARSLDGWNCLIAALDLDRGALLPSRVGLLPVPGEPPRGGPREASPRGPDGLEWPGSPPRELRRLARGRTLIVVGGANEREALSRWLAGARHGSLFCLEALLRRAGRHSLSRRASAGPSADYDPPLSRCRAAVDAVARLCDVIESEGRSGWEEVHEWLEDKPDFDFSGKAFDRTTLQALPEGPGVYRFYDSAGRLLYVGQSRRLRARVGSYFRATLPPASRQARIAAGAHRIEVIAEGSDLTARVREASEIRRLRPSINRQRLVHRRHLPARWTGARVVILPGRSRRSRDVFFLRDGEVLDRRRMSPAPGVSTWKAWHRAVALLARYYFGRPAQGALPGVRGARRNPASIRPGISRHSAEEAGRLLASIVRQSENQLLSFDPTESPDEKDAARRLLAYLEAGPSSGGDVLR